MSLLSQPLALDLAMLSARPSLAPIARVFVKIAVVMVTWDETYRSRRHLRELTPEQLEDIGISKEHAWSEARRPPWSR